MLTLLSLMPSFFHSVYHFPSPVFPSFHSVPNIFFCFLPLRLSFISFFQNQCTQLFFIFAWVCGTFWIQSSVDYVLYAQAVLLFHFFFLAQKSFFPMSLPLICNKTLSSASHISGRWCLVYSTGETEILIVFCSYSVWVNLFILISPRWLAWNLLLSLLRAEWSVHVLDEAPVITRW